MTQAKPYGCVQRLGHRSRMSREVQVRFCEGLGVRFPRATRPARAAPTPEGAIFKLIELCGVAAAQAGHGSRVEQRVAQLLPQKQ